MALFPKTPLENELEMQLKTSQCLGKIAKNMLKKDTQTKEGIKGKRLKAAYDNLNLQNVLLLKWEFVLGDCLLSDINDVLSEKKLYFASPKLSL